MSMPSNRLATVSAPSAMLPPDSIVRRTRTIDHERGGVAINDGTQGMLVRDWTAELDGDDVVVYRFGDPGSATVLFTEAGITHLSLAFDQLMRPAVAYIANGQAKLWWYDTVPASMVFTVLDPDVKCPTVTMDDKRYGAQTRNDVLLFYIRGHQLFYRQQRDRYTIERLLKSFPGSQLFIRRAGMNRGQRIQVEVVGSDNRPDHLVTAATSWTAAQYEVAATSINTTLPGDIDTATLLLAFVMTRTGPITVPGGWVLVDSQACTDGTITQTLGVYRRTSPSGSLSGAPQAWTQPSAERIGVAYVAVKRSNGSTPVVLQAGKTAINSTSTVTIAPPVLQAVQQQELFITAATSIAGTATVAPPVAPQYESLRSGSASQTRLGVAVRARYWKRKNAGSYVFPASVTNNGLAAITLRIGV